MQPDRLRVGAGPALLGFGVVVGLTHHVGLLTEPLGTVGSTSWNDWLDLLVPYLVVGSALAVLLSVRPDRIAWGLFVAGAIAYVQGHGLHLAANSVANTAPGPTAHVWDEVAGHVIWYGGLALLVVALVRGLSDVPLRVDAWGWAAAVGFGATVGTNAVGGGTIPGSLPVSLAFLAYGLRRRDALGTLLAVTFALGVVVMLVDLAGLT